MGLNILNVEGELVPESNSDVPHLLGRDDVAIIRKKLPKDCHVDFDSQVLYLVQPETKQILNIANKLLRGRISHTESIEEKLHKEVSRLEALLGQVKKEKNDLESKLKSMRDLLNMKETQLAELESLRPEWDAQLLLIMEAIANRLGRYPSSGDIQVLSEMNGHDQAGEIEIFRSMRRNPAKPSLYPSPSALTVTKALRNLSRMQMMDETDFFGKAAKRI